MAESDHARRLAPKAEASDGETLMGTAWEEGQVVRPTRGVWKFRRTCGPTIEDRVLVVTDHRGHQHRFPFDGSDRVPSRYLMSFDSWWWVIVDGQNQAIVKGGLGEWDHMEVIDLIKPLGATDGFAPNMEPDPQQPKWASWVLQARFRCSRLRFARRSSLAFRRG